MATQEPGPDLDYTRLIAERTSDFTGRNWVLRAMNGWLAGPAPRTFVLAGLPGTGKTSIAARIVQMHLGQVEAGEFSRLSRGCLAYHHFCQAGGQDSTLSPLTFVQCLSQALASRYPPVREAIEQQGSSNVSIHSVVDVASAAAGANVTGVKVRIEILSGDARPAFDQLVRRPLRSRRDALPSENIVILVDSLDEALSFNPQNNILQLLRLVDDFPPQVRFLLTCRSNNQEVLELVGPPSLDLIRDAPAAEDEVRTYAMARLARVPEPGRSTAAGRVAEKSRGNFLYAYHVLNDLTGRGVDVTDADTQDLPDQLEDVYRKFLERGVASNQARWNDIYRPVIGAIAVARGEGLTRKRLVGITGLAEDTAADVLKSTSQYLVGGENGATYGIYHQSFRDFLLSDGTYSVFPGDRHAAIARYLQDECGPNWGTCNDAYALQHTPVHWAEAATLSEGRRSARTQALVELTGNPKYRRTFERRIGNLPALNEHVRRAVQVAALDQKPDMLPWLVRAAEEYVAFRRDYLQAEALVKLADDGKLDQAEGRLRLFADVDEDWRTATRLVIAWLGIERNRPAAEEVATRVSQVTPAEGPLRTLAQRLAAELGQPSTFAVEMGGVPTLEFARELVKRISGQEFDREMLSALNPSLMPAGGVGPEFTSQRGYAAEVDAPVLVAAARSYGEEGTALVDQYVSAHAGYNYVEYRNKSLWYVLDAVLRLQPDPAWVKERLRRILVAALSGGAVEFQEELPLAADLLKERAATGDVRPALEHWRRLALAAADALRDGRGADDSWGRHKRRLIGFMELTHLLASDGGAVTAMLDRIRALPGGFAGFQAPAYLRLADALNACGLEAIGQRGLVLEDALRSAHHVQDYHFCARVTARCNALRRWHDQPMTGQDLAAAIRRLAASPADVEFAADHRIHEPYLYRQEGSPGVLPITKAREAGTLEQLVEVFQRPAVEFRRLNPHLGLSQPVAEGALIRVPDPGLAPLLAVHLGARALAQPSLDEERVALLRSLVPVAIESPTALDSVLAYLLVASDLDDVELLDEIAAEVGPVEMAHIAAPAAQIGPDAAIPS